MAHIRTLPQSKEALLKAFTKKLKDDVRSMLDNYTEIVKLSKVEEESQVSRMTQCEEDHFEMLVRAANIVRAGESLVRLATDLKQYVILNDFPSANEAITQTTKAATAKQQDYDKKLTTLREELAVDLYDVEEEYYYSSLK